MMTKFVSSKSMLGELFECGPTGTEGLACAAINLKERTSKYQNWKSALLSTKTKVQYNIVQLLL